MKPTIKQLMEYGPCDEGRKYLKSKCSAMAAWRACDNPDWMIWALTKFNLWDERLARTFAIKCAEHTLHFFEEKYPDDKRLRLALQAAQDFQDGKITEEQRSAAESAAWSAARSAAESAAWSAARSAAESAARSAAESAAESAAWSAARSAAESAAESAARSAEEQESKWQADTLRSLIDPFKSTKE